MDIMSTLIDIARGSGAVILKHYHKTDQSNITFKEDGSPLTLADQASHSHICSHLKAHFNWPVLSEEDPIEYNVRKDWARFWLVDPLDGTKDFIAANDEFTVNIALIENGVPVLGLIYAPALDEIYFAKKGDGARLIRDGLETKLPNKQCSGIIAGRSRFHDSDSFDEFLKINKIESSIAFGSALKFGKLALGVINIYPRFVGSSEWDIAAGHLIVNEAGCDIIDLETFREPVYNKTSIRNNNFIAHNKKLNFSDFNLPKDVK